ncbi:MAG TPA: prolipoprotein diacylglyceryl transferase [Thermodesulfobacteriota bacterium]|nr:prolipoprotein diacylglyceryl transferase [Thermodesulfobacteriota bacterium]
MHPILFQSGGLHIYAYGFFIVVGIAAAAALAVPKARKSGIHLSFENMTELFFYTVLSAYLGSRILYGLVNFDAFRRDPLQIFKIWEGGLVFYGALFPAAVVAFWYVQRHRLPFWKLADLISPLIALGLSSGRVGCFLAGCCYGKETSLLWAVVFRNPDSLARLNTPLHPTQLYDAANGLALFFFLSWIEKRKAFDGQIFWLFLLLYSVIRFFIEIFRGDPRGFLFGGLLSTSQGIGILLAIFSLFMLFYLRRRHLRYDHGCTGNP